MLVYYFLIFVAVSAILGINSVDAFLCTEEVDAIKKGLHPYFLECIEESGMTQEDMLEMKKDGLKSEHAPCFVSCMCKKIGVFDSNAMYDIDRALELTKRYIKKEEDIAFIVNAKRDCAKVNKEEVSDGDKGCDRAKLLVNCLLGHKKKWY